MHLPRLARTMGAGSIGLLLAACALTGCAGGDPASPSGSTGGESAPDAASSVPPPEPSSVSTPPDTTSSSEPSPESSSASTPPDTASPGPAEVATECVDGQWSADLQDLLAQLTRQFSSSGLNIASSNASGSQELVIGREGVLGFHTEMAFVMTIDMGGGPSMKVTQTHAGSMSADWQWTGPTPDGGTMEFSHFQDSGYHVENTVVIGDKSSSLPFEPPSVAAADVPTEVTCSGDTMTTHPRGTPFTTTWTRTGSS